MCTYVRTYEKKKLLCGGGFDVYIGMMYPSHTKAVPSINSFEGNVYF